MGKLGIPSIIRLEDYKEEDREMMEKLAGALNPFMEDVYRQLNGNLNTDNLTRQIGNVDVRMNAAGVVVNSPQIKLRLKARVSGIQVISAQNLTNSTTYPTTAPFISYTISGDLVTIKNITGLQASSEYRLVVEIIGN